MIPKIKRWLHDPFSVSYLSVKGPIELLLIVILTYGMKKSSKVLEFGEQ